MSRLFSVVTLAALLLSAQPVSALTLDEYLGEVRRKNLGYASSEQQKQAAALAGREADLITSPSVFANAQHASEGKQPLLSAMTYDQVEIQNYSLGLQQQFEFGLTGKLYYAIDRTGYVGSSIPGSRGYAYDARPVVELAIPLWQNLGGRTTKATVELARQQSEAQRFAADAQGTALLVQAEVAYWRLAVAREGVIIQAAALEQAEAILSYVSKRAGQNLGEKADVLQARALTTARRLELKRARDEENAALHAFNVLRQGSLVEKVERLDKIDFAAVEKIAVPATRPGERAETLAAKAQAELSKANATIQEDKYRAKVELFGSYALNGHDSEVGTAVDDSLKPETRTNAVGVRVSMPLNWGATSSVQRSAALASSAASMQYEQQAYQQDADWQDLTRRISEAKETLKLAQAMEDAQDAKLATERQRLRQGRTTTYQVLMFEQDYSQAALAQLQAAGLILTLVPQTKFYVTQNAEGGQP